MTAGSPAPARALALVCAAATGIAVNYTNHGPLLGLIAAEFELSAAEAGAIATAFWVGATATIIFTGVFSDRFGARPVLTVGLGLVALGNIAAGPLAPSYPALLAWRVIAGVGGGVGFVAGASYIRGAFPKGAAQLSQGLYGASYLLGSGSTLLFMPALAGEAHDWRRAFLLSGLAVAVCWLAWVWLAPPGAQDRPGPSASLRAALCSRNAWLLALCHMCGFGLAIVVSTWATVFLAQTFALPLGTAGALGSLLLIIGIVARSMGGAILDRSLPPIRLIQAGLALEILGLGMLALPSGSLPLALAGLLVIGLGAGLPFAAVLNGAAASVPRSPASAQAVVGWGGTIFSLAGPPVVGALLDLTGSFSAGLTALAAFALLVLAGTTRLHRWPAHRSH